MNALIRQLYGLLDRKQKKKIIIIQLLIFITSVSEIVAIGSIGPFMSVVGNTEVLESGGFISDFFKWSGIASSGDFVFLLGVFSIGLLLVGSIISVFNSWITILYSQQIGASISNKLYEHYLYKKWEEHSVISSSELTKRIAQESGRLTNGIILPLMQMNSKIVLIFLMLVALIVYNPLVTMSGIMLFSSAYIIIYKFVRLRLHVAGKQLSDVNTERFKLMAEGFGGIRDILLMRRQGYYVERFRKENDKVVDSQTLVQTLSIVPKYIIELLAFGSIILFVLFLLKEYSGDLSEILPVLAIFGLTGFKLLPALQAVYSCVAKVKGNLAAFEAIQNDLTGSKNREAVAEGDFCMDYNNLYLDKVFLKYPTKSEYALKNISINIKAKSTVGFVGASGSGKSTIIDLIMGLLTPTSGCLKLDDSELNFSNLRVWQSKIGLVPQTIFLSDASILENIGFGLPISEIEMGQAMHACKLACLDEFIGSLPNGIYTTVGERGVQLSGGQRQRIGIARALYNNAELLVFDEATSALDGVTERNIMKAINDLSGQRTLIMVAHRLSTVKKCDVIYYMDDGEIVASGSYGELLESNEKFKELDLLS